jgi:hypothetical protein
LEKQSEAKGISPTFSKSKVKRIELFQKFGKTKQSEVNLLKILQDRSKTNIFVPNCIKEEKRKKEASFFSLKKRKKNEYNRSSTIEDLPLLIRTQNQRISEHAWPATHQTNKDMYHITLPLTAAGESTHTCSINHRRVVS